MKKQALKFVLGAACFTVFCVAMAASLSLVQAQVTQTIQVSTQRFEHGLMIWRGDTSLVWVLTDDGGVRVYPWESYNHLPDNTYFGNPPDYKRLRPIFAFGQIWGSDASLRARIGWPTLPEIGFSTLINQVGDTTYFTELDQTTIKLNDNNTWVRLGIPPISPTPTGRTGLQQAIAFQQYERGFMIWWAGSGHVSVHSGSGVSYVRILSFAQKDYENLPDNPISDISSGFVTPVNAFGKVWGNHPEVRESLGHAIAAEIGHTTTISNGTLTLFHKLFDLPNGRIVQEIYGHWSFYTAN